MIKYFKFHRGTKAEGKKHNPVLPLDSPALETDTGKWKVGDGVAHWNDLPYTPAEEVFRTGKFKYDDYPSTFATITIDRSEDTA